MENRVLWIWTIGEVIVAVILSVIGLAIIPTKTVYKFDHSLEIIVGVVLMLAVAMVILLALSRGQTKLARVVAASFLVFDALLVIIGFFVLFGCVNVWMRKIEDAWTESSFAETVTSFQAAHDCCGLQDEVQPPCEANFSCYGELRKDVKGVCNGVGTGIVALGFATVPQGVSWFVVWLYRKKKESIAALRAKQRQEGLIEEQHPVVEV
jgi:hypothetical protein